MSGLQDYEGAGGRGKFYFVCLQWDVFLFGSFLHLYTIEGWGIMGIS